MSAATTPSGLPTREVVERLSSNIPARKDTLFAAPVGSSRGELVKKIADYHDKLVAEWFLFGPNPLDPDLPESVSADPFTEGRLRRPR